jgi:hypothetical protein
MLFYFMHFNEAFRLISVTGVYCSQKSVQIFRTLILQRQDGHQTAQDQLNQEKNDLEGETA